MLGTSKPIHKAPDHLDPETLDGLLQNVMELVATLDGNSFQQITALFAPRQGYPESDAILFNATTAREFLEHLLNHKINARLITVTKDKRGNYSIVFAKSNEGIKKAVTAAVKWAKRHRARITVEP